MDRPQFQGFEFLKLFYIDPSRISTTFIVGIVMLLFGLSMGVSYAFYPEFVAPTKEEEKGLFAIAGLLIVIGAIVTYTGY